MPPPLLLFYCHWVKGRGSWEDLLTWAPSLEGRQQGWSHSQGALELLGSNWEFGKACLPASRPAACPVLRLGFYEGEGAKGVPVFSFLSSPAHLRMRGSICPCVLLTSTEATLRG